MKKQNLTREEAMKAMIDGLKVGCIDPSYSKFQYFFCRENNSFKTKQGQINTEVPARMYPEDGYYIIEPEPKFKEVVIYAAVFNKWYGCNNYIIDKRYFEDSDHALNVPDSVGYTEVKVFLKEE